MIIQFCGLPGSGKTTLANEAKQLLALQQIAVEIIDGDEYRKGLSSDLGFSREDRQTNIRRLAFIASRFSRHGIISIISAINPYNEIRKEITECYPFVRTVYIHCPLETLISRDPKGLYRRALLPDSHPEKISNLTGINDPFEIPEAPDLAIDTSDEDVNRSSERLVSFILANCKF